jgi:hypothetical protein
MTKKMFLAPLVLLSLGLASTADAEVPDRCQELGPDGYPAHCEPIGEHIAPLWDSSACCDDERCVEPGLGGCPGGTNEYSCKYAEPDGNGSLTCLYLVPHYCDEHPCPNDDPDFGAPPQENVICCYQEGCYDTQGGLCGGLEYWCENGVSNIDGTTTCFDGDIPW